MHLKLNILNNELKSVYENSNISNYSTDSGFDLFTPNRIIVPKNAISYKIPLGIKSEPSFKDDIPRGYYLYLRSSTGSKTPLRMSNMVGIIDFDYRGEICGIIDNLSNEDWIIEKHQRLFQLCSPDLSPINITLNDNLRDTIRSEQGFGSTGN